jgi:DNA repair exonuclease SbcCD nuclease subunit
MMSFHSWLFWIIIAAVVQLAICLYVLLSGRRRHSNFSQQYAKRPYAEADIAYSVFLVGDMGALSTTKKDSIRDGLKAQLHEAAEKSAIVFLGDNIYPRGMPEENDSTRHRAEDRAKAQLDMLKTYPGKFYFISGNHDWNKGKSGGWEAVLRQEKFMESYLDRGNFFLPDHGCPGPEEISLTDDITLIIINTQWFVHEGERPIGLAHGCKANDKAHFYELLRNMLKANAHKKILIAGHHPMYSNALHGGKFTLKQHLFPLTDAYKKLYIPIPIVGSLYPLYRKVYGAREDISHPTYKRMRRRLLREFAPYKNLVYAAGHDHNLQHIIKHHQHYLVSGSGSKVAFVKKGGKASYAESSRGFMRINYLKTGEPWLEAWTYEKYSEELKMTYITSLS